MGDAPCKNEPLASQEIIARIAVAPTREQIETLQRDLISRIDPDALHDYPTEHYFSNGMYCRKATFPANRVIVGAVHKEEHLFILASGQAKVWTEQGESILNSGDVVCGGAGVKRVVLTISECIGINVFRTDSTDLDEIEKQIIEDDPTSLFDIRLHLKNKAIEQAEGDHKC